MDVVKENKEKKKLLTIKEYLELKAGKFTDRDVFALSLSYSKESPKTENDWEKLLK